jgi:hypothetical protein
MNVKDSVLNTKNRRENISSRFAHSDRYWGGVSRYGATPFIVAFATCHSDITKFRSRSLVTTGKHLNSAEIVPEIAQVTGNFEVFDPRSGISGPTLRRSIACPNLFE